MQVKMWMHSASQQSWDRCYAAKNVSPRGLCSVIKSSILNNDALTTVTGLNFERDRPSL